MVEHKMHCPICKKDYIKEALHIGGIPTNENGRLILPCEMHTPEERRENWLKRGCPDSNQLNIRSSQ